MQSMMYLQNIQFKNDRKAIMAFNVQSSHPCDLIIKYFVYSRVPTNIVLTTMERIEVAYISLLIP